MNSTHYYEQLIGTFSNCFADGFNTYLTKDDDEPIYLPASAEVPHNRIVLAHDFYVSTIYEVSHWCIAGKARREPVDSSYWYCSDRRDTQTRSQFEDVEVEPQALDWLFCVTVGYPFNVSCDNLEGDFEPDRVVFQRRVYAQMMDYLTNGILERPARFVETLQDYYYVLKLTAEQLPWSEVLNWSQCHVLQQGKRMIMGFESRTLALVDGIVDHASNDRLFASGYLHDHLTLAIVELESDDDHSTQAMHMAVSQSLEKAIGAGELSLRDQVLATGMWENLSQQASQQ